MKHKIQKGISMFLSVLLLGQSIPAALAVSEDEPQGESVAITQEVFPDAGFRSWLKNPAHISGYGADGLLTQEELAEIRAINVAGQNLTSLQGIEVFSALESLDCQNNRLTELDVRQNRELKYLHCAFNRIRSLDVSGLGKLISLVCENNGMTELDLTGCTALEIIYCRSNNLPKVDFSSNTSLKFIETFDNRLTEVDLSMLSNLEFVHLDHNRLTHLDLSKNTNLSPIGSGFVACNNWLDTLTLPVSSTVVVDASVYDEQDPKTGYERTAWYMDQEFTQPAPKELPANGQTLYVKWLPNDYTIYYSANGGSGSMPSQAAVWDEELTLPESGFTRFGYRFGGWKDTYGDGTLYEAQETVKNLAGEIQGDRVTLYAQWNPIQYSISFDENGGSGEMHSVTATYDRDLRLPDCGFTAPADMKFAGWSLTPNGTVRYKDGASVRNLTAQEGETITLYAIWRERATNQYLLELDRIFSSYVPSNYTAQDWAALAAEYERARAELAAAEEEQLDALLAQAKEQMEQVTTLDERAEQVADLWRETYDEIIRKVDGRAVQEENAASVYMWAERAMEALTPEFVADRTDLSREEDCQLAASAAVQREKSTMQGLRRLDEAAQWAASLDGLSTRAMSEVTAAWLSAYEEAVAEAASHAAQLQRAFVDALQQRAQLAQQKQQAATQVHMDYSSYDQANYDAEGIRQLEQILHTALAEIEQASSEAEVASLVKRAQEDFKAVPDINGQTPPEGGDGSGSGDGDGGSSGGGSSSGGSSSGGSSSGGSGSVSVPTYSITKPAQISHGQVTIKPERAKRGDTVTITAKPESGYELGQLTVKDKSGNAVAVKKLEDGKYTFTMPASPVEVQVTFERVSSPSTAFADVPADAYYAKAVTWAVEQGITSGTGEGTFGPDQSCTRAQIVTFLWRAAGSPAPQNQTNPFRDLSRDAYYYDAMLWAVENGVIGGTTAVTCEPDAPCTRAQAVTMLWRTAGSPMDNGKNEFLDVPEDAYYAPAASWAAKQGITSGIGDGLFGADQTCTRAQIMTFLYQKVQRA